MRAQQLQLSAVEGLLARATEAAKAVTEQLLHIEASGVTLDGEVVLAATPDSGRWVLQAWYAGLRGLTTFLCRFSGRSGRFTSRLSVCIKGRLLTESFAGRERLLCCKRLCLVSPSCSRFISWCNRRSIGPLSTRLLDC